MPFPADLTSRYKDSWAPLVISIKMREANGNAFSETELPECFQSLTLNVLKGAKTATLTLFDRRGDILYGLFAIRKGLSLFRLQWAWAYTPTSLDQAPVWELMMNAVPAIVRTSEGVGLTLNLIGSENRAEARSIFGGDTVRKDGGSTVSTARTWGYRAGLPGWTISDIVIDICDRAGWAYVVEPTVGAFNSVFTLKPQQKYVDFIAAELLPKAVNSVKEPYCYYFDEAGALHFHSHTYRAGDNGGLPAIKRYIVYRDPMGDVLSFMPSDWANAVWEGAVVNGVQVDSKKGTVKTEHANPVQGVSGEGFANVPLDNRGYQDIYNKRPHAQRTYDSTSQVLIPSRDYVEGEAKLRSMYHRIALNQFQAELVIKGTHVFSDMRAGLPVVQVEFYDNLNATWIDDPYSGYYQVQDVEHEINGGFWTTTLKLMRYGYKSTEKTIAVRKVLEIPSGGGTPPKEYSGGDS